MTNFSEASGSGFHPVYAKDSHDGHGERSWGSMWVFALVIIFLALVFLWGRKDNYDGNRSQLDSILPLLAAQNMPKHNGCELEHWDSMKYSLTQFGDLKKEIVETAWGQAKENDRYFYDQRAAIDKTNFDSLLGFKSAEISGLQNTAKIEARIDGLERRLDADIIRKQGEEINYLKTVAALAPKPPMPAYYPNYGMPPHPQHVFMAEQACC